MYLFASTLLSTPGARVENRGLSRRRVFMAIAGVDGTGGDNVTLFYSGTLVVYSGTWSSQPIAIVQLPSFAVIGKI